MKINVSWSNDRYFGLVFKAKGFENNNDCALIVSKLLTLYMEKGTETM